MQHRVVVPVGAPPERVWSILEDVERWPEWTKSMISITRLDPGPLRVGSEAKIRQPRAPAAVWKVTALESQRSFTWETRNLGVVTAAGHVIEPDGAGGSAVTLVVDLTGPAAPLAGALFGRMIRRYVQMEAEGLRKAAERADRD